MPCRGAKMVGIHEFCPEGTSQNEPNPYTSSIGFLHDDDLDMVGVVLAAADDDDLTINRGLLDSRVGSAKPSQDIGSNQSS